MTASVDQNSTPYEFFDGTVADISRLKVFGCKAFVVRQHRNKLDPTSEKGLLFGYQQHSKGWLVLVEREGFFHIVQSCNVRVVEN